MTGQSTKAQRPAICYVCKVDFNGDFHELARHWNKKRKDKLHRVHRSSIIWAVNYLLDTRRLDKKKDRPQRAKLTEQEKENKKEMARGVSGETELVITQCPDCKVLGRMQLPVEFTRSGQAWKIGDKIARFCRLHTREKNEIE